MEGKEYTINQAAELLGVDPATIRRRIKGGKLQATLKESPYGKQYFIPASELQAAIATVEVVKVNSPVSSEQLMQEIRTTIAEAAGEAIQDRLDTLTEQIKAAVRAAVAEYEQEKERIRLEEKERRRSRWQFWRREGEQ